MPNDSFVFPSKGDTVFEGLVCLRQVQRSLALSMLNCLHTNAKSVCRLFLSALSTLASNANTVAAIAHDMSEALLCPAPLFLAAQSFVWILLLTYEKLNTFCLASHVP